MISGYLKRRTEMEKKLANVRHYFNECLGVLSIKEITHNETMIENANRVQSNFEQKLMERA